MPSRGCNIWQGTVDKLRPDFSLVSSFTRSRRTRLDHTRCFYSAFDDDGKAHSKNRLQEHGWEPWSHSNGRMKPSPAQVDNKNIFIGDLNATLDAHRTANRIRKISTFGPHDQSAHQLSSLEHEATSLEVFEEKAQIRKVRPRARPSRSQERRLPQAYGEYVAELRWPTRVWALSNIRERPKELSPWLDFVDSTSMYGTERLSAEIAAYEKYMQLSDSEVQASKDVQETVSQIVKQAIPATTIDLAGSQSIGLAAPASDIDFRVSLAEYQRDPFERGPSPGRPKACKAAMKLLRELERTFTASEAFEKTKIINAIVPILKTTHVGAQISVDFKVSYGEIPQEFYTALYMAEYPTLRPLYMLLRSALHMRDLGTVFYGGLGSYPTVIMIVYALKTCPRNISPTDVGSQLLWVLDFYASANLYEKGFSLTPPAEFSKAHGSYRRLHAAGHDDLVAQGIDRIGRIHRKQPYSLCLQDPADPNNDLGSRSYGIKDVQKLFGWAGTRMRDNMRKMESDDLLADKIWNLEGILFPLAGANYEDFERRRRRQEQNSVLPMKLDANRQTKDLIRYREA